MALEIYAGLIGRRSRPRTVMFQRTMDTSPIELIYPFWVLRDERRVRLVDTGFTPEVAEKREIEDYCDPLDLLRALDIRPDDVETVIASHLHYDHFCAPERFPNATFYVQVEDVDYFTGRGAAYPAAHAVEKESLVALDGLRRSGRLREINGIAHADDLLLVLVGGHTPGSQLTVTRAGGRPIVLACDAAHYYDNVRQRTPTTMIHSYEAYQRGFATIEALAEQGVWYPGHDGAMLDELEQVDDRLYRVPQPLSGEQAR